MCTWNMLKYWGRQCLHPWYFNNVTFLKSPHGFKKLTFLLSTNIKVLHYFIHRCLSRSTPLMSALKVANDKSFNLSTLPSSVTKECSYWTQSFLGFYAPSFSQSLSPLRLETNAELNIFWLFLFFYPNIYS